MHPAMLLTLAVLPVVTFAVGVVLGAWLWHRARSGKSPLPRLPSKADEPETPPTVRKAHL